MAPIILRALYKHLRATLPQHQWEFDDRSHPEDCRITLTFIEPITKLRGEFCSIYYFNGVIEGCWELEPQLNVQASDPELFQKTITWIEEMIAWEFGRTSVKG